MGLERREGILGVLDRFPVISHLEKLQYHHFEKFAQRVASLSTSEQLLGEQQRLDRLMGVFRFVARSTLAVEGVAALAMTTSSIGQNLIRQYPEPNMLGFLALVLIGVGSAHAWWITDVKRNYLQQRLAQEP